MKIRVERHERKTKKTTEKINETKGWFLEKINKMDRSLARLTRKKKKIGKTQINTIRNEREVTTDTTEIHRLIKKY